MIIPAYDIFRFKYNLSSYLNDCEWDADVYDIYACHFLYKQKYLIYIMDFNSEVIYVNDVFSSIINIDDFKYTFILTHKIEVEHWTFKYDNEYFYIL